LRADPEAWRAEQEERAQWDGTLADGQASDPWAGRLGPGPMTEAEATEFLAEETDVGSALALRLAQIGGALLALALTDADPTRREHLADLAAEVEAVERKLGA
jgi:hypothetical protein